MIYVIAALLCVLFYFNPDTDYYSPKWTLGVMLSCCVVGWYVANINIYVSAVYIYCSIRATWFAFWHNPNHFTMPKGRNTTIVSEMQKGLIYSTIAACIFAFTSRDIINLIILSIPFVSIVNSLMGIFPIRIIDTRKKEPVFCYGFGGNRSVNSTTCAILGSASLISVDLGSPSWLSHIAIALAIIACIKQKGTIGLGSVLFAVVIYYNDVLGVYSQIALITIAIVSSIFIKQINKKLFFGQLFSLSGRDRLFSFVNKNVIKGFKKTTFGIGPYCFSYVVPTMQISLKDRTITPDGNIYFIWAHCDWYQLFIENGIVGSIIALFLVASIICALFFIGSKALVAFFVCYAINMAGNFPTHLLPDSFVGIIILRYLLQ